jgi:hypothetical protein
MSALFLASSLSFFKSVGVGLCNLMSIVPIDLQQNPPSATHLFIIPNIPPKWRVTAFCFGRLRDRKINFAVNLANAPTS